MSAFITTGQSFFAPGILSVSFSPTQLTGLAAWYKASSLVSNAIDPGSISGAVARYRADSITGVAPNTISGCTGWFRADLGVTLNGSRVSAWADQSGNGHNLTQAVSANQPTFVASAAEFNNRPALSFNAGDADWLSSAAGWVLGPNMSIIIIGEDNGVAAGYAGVNDSNIWFLLNHGGVYSTAGAGFVDSTVSVSANTPRIFAFTVDISNNGTWYINSGTTKGTGGVGYSPNSTGFVVGALNNLNTTGLTGKIVEVAVFNRPLTATEVADIQNYASIRYNIATISTVHAWNDTVSGDLTHNAFQSTDTKTPSLNVSDATYGNQPSISFVSANSQWLTTQPWTSSLAAPFSIVVIGNDDGVATIQQFTDAEVPNAETGIIYANAGVYDWYSGSVRHSGIATSSDPKVIAANFGTSGTIYVNTNGSNGAGGSTGTNPLTGLTLGNSSTGNNELNGKIAEMIVFNKALSQAEVNGIQAYARTRYGINPKMSSWTDQATPHDATHDTSQSTYTQMPTLNVSDAAYNNQSTVSFNSSALQLLGSPHWTSALTSPLTIIAVYNADTLNGQQLVVFSDFAGELELNARDGTGGEPSIYNGSFLPITAGQTAAIHATVGIYDSSGLIYDTAKTAAVSGSTGTQGMGEISLGAVSPDAGGGGQLNGKIAEVIIYNRALNTTEINQNLAYLGGKYGLIIGA